ncbi:MAG: hypothetical protein ACHP8B_04615 [Terriglobales bacterium]
MLWLRWTFIALNVIVCLLALFDTSRKFTSEGKREIATPGAWIYIWQLVGVGIVIWGGFSAWHLVWWFVVGFIVFVRIAKLMMWMGHDPLK